MILTIIFFQYSGFCLRFINLGLRTNFTKGGVCAFKTKSYGEKEKMEPMEKMIVNDREGFYGWFGLGGSILQVHDSVYTVYIVVKTISLKKLRNNNSNIPYFSVES